MWIILILKFLIGKWYLLIKIIAKMSKMTKLAHWPLALHQFLSKNLSINGQISHFTPSRMHRLLGKVALEGFIEHSVITITNMLQLSVNLNIPSISRERSLIWSNLTNITIQISLNFLDFSTRSVLVLQEWVTLSNGIPIKLIPWAKKDFKKPSRMTFFSKTFYSNSAKQA